MEEILKTSPPINGGTVSYPGGGLHHMWAAVLASQYEIQIKSLCEHHNNVVYDTELFSLIFDLQKAWNLNLLGIV